LLSKHVAVASSRLPSKLLAAEYSRLLSKHLAAESSRLPSKLLAAGSLRLLSKLLVAASLRLLSNFWHQDLQSFFVDSCCYDGLIQQIPGSKACSILRDISSVRIWVINWSGSRLFISLRILDMIWSGSSGCPVSSRKKFIISAYIRIFIQANFNIMKVSIIMASLH
jgi:hypothetical protein